MDIPVLLTEISGIAKKYDLISRKTGGYFNIFEIVGISTDEVKICRIIHELINPKGCHCQGHLYLKHFIEIVLGLDGFTDEEYKKASVYREKVIDNNRRIDLFIKIKDRQIPIEVKIYAEDQDSQCFDYAKKAKNSKVYYLTLSGYSPSSESARTYDDTECRSFEYHILKWLYKCIEAQETIRTAPIREILFQLIEVVRRLTNQMEEGKEVEIQSVLKSSENMRSADLIEKAAKKCRTEMIREVLSKIEESIGRERLKDKNNLHDYQYDNGAKINNYYKNNQSTYPGISYLYRKAAKPGVDIWFRVEIEDGIFAGFCVPVDGKAREQVLSNDEIKELLKIDDPIVSYWWAHWKYLPSGNQENSPDFKNFNDAYYDLYDENKFKTFIADCVEFIKQMWPEI